MIKQPLRIRNHYGEATFSVFFSKLINFLFLTDLERRSKNSKKT